MKIDVFKRNGNLQERIVSTCICILNKDKDLKGQNVVLGKGSVNFDSICRAIKKIKYKGKLVFETNRGNNPINTMINNKEFILERFKRLK